MDLTEKQKREKIIDLVGAYHPSVGQHVSRKVFDMVRKEYTERIAALEDELGRLMEWNNFPPSFSDRDRALALLQMNDRGHPTANG